MDTPAAAPASPPARTDSAVEWRSLWASLAAPEGVTRERLRAGAQNRMEQLYYGDRDREVNKWHHYLAIYDRHLNHHRGSAVRILEIGINQGGSLQLWRDFFGPDAVIHGIDVNPDCARIDDPGITVHIGSQSNPAFLKKVVAAMGEIDVVIDDGGHISPEQIVSFRTLFPALSPHGIYIFEDLHAAYWSMFKGGLKAPDSVMAFLKDRIDDLHAHYFPKADAPRRDAVIPGIRSVTVYDSVAVVEKGPFTRPFPFKVGSRRLLPAPGQPGV